MKSIGPKISDRHHKMLRSLTQFFEGQRPAIERAIEDAFNRYIDISDMARLMSGESRYMLR